MNIQADQPSVPLMPRAIVLGATHRLDVSPRAEELQGTIQRYCRIAAADFTGRADLSGVEADLAIVLGGDGSIMRAARQMGDRQLPVVAVNLGKLGFLADVSPGELENVLREYCAGRLVVLDHLMYVCSLIRHGQCLWRQLGLNDVVVHAGTPFTILNVDLFVDGELATTYSCDGVIISTPVGSTAYCLSAGGPILCKTLRAFVILPISPHTLTNRPVVESARRVYEMVVERPNAGTSVVVDGRVLGTLLPGDRVRVEQAAVTFKLVAAPGHSYYRTLRDKLGWGGRFRPNNNGPAG